MLLLTGVKKVFFLRPKGKYIVRSPPPPSKHNQQNLCLPFLRKLERDLPKQVKKK